MLGLLGERYPRRLRKVIRLAEMIVYDDLRLTYALPLHYFNTTFFLGVSFSILAFLCILSSWVRVSFKN
jgi:hypothetical protein